MMKTIDSTKLKIKKGAVKRSAMGAAPRAAAAPSGGASGNIVDEIRKGVSLKKTEINPEGKKPPPSKSFYKPTI
jgi:hypothetical protein